jgi:LacI family transcriptional regulator
MRRGSKLVGFAHKFTACGVVGRGVAMKQRVTIIEVAKKSGVAVSTVSRVLNGGYASPGVRSRVQSIVRQLGYVPSTSARGLKLGRTGLIGFVSWNVFGTWASGLLRGIEDELVGRSSSVVIASLGLRGTYDPSAVRAWVGERRVDGLILARAKEENSELIEALKESNIPTVIISGDCEFGYGVSVTTKNKKAGAIAADHLIQLGHQRIACWAGPKESLAARARYEGVKEALEAKGLSLMEEHSGFAANYHSDACVGYARRWLSLPAHSRPTGVVMANDEQAMLFLKMLLDRGVSVPDEVSVVGFDGIEQGARFWPGITTVAQPLHAIGSAAARVVLQMVEGTEEHVPEHLEFDTELIVRESTGPAPENAYADSEISESFINNRAVLEPLEAQA